MHWHTLATDYDGTIATHGIIDAPTIAALQRYKAAGGTLLLVTGRELRDFPALNLDLRLFDLIVAENGGVLYTPADEQSHLLTHPPSQELVEELKKRDVQGISVGQTIIATWEPHQHAALEAIMALQLELQLTFNKGAIMILPSGINKASGLTAALELLKISPEHVVGVGDAENDHAFLEKCGLSVAVGNALPAVKEKTRVVTEATHGAGVCELIDRLLLGHFDEFATAATPAPSPL